MTAARTFRLSWLCSAALTLAAVSAVAGDWPFERGDAAGAGVAATKLPAEPELLWEFKAGNALEVTPVTAGGVAYLGDAGGTFYAVKLADGSKLWSQEFEDAIFIAAAAVEGERVVVADLDGIVRCLSTKDGGELWTADAENEVNAGPTIAGGLALVTTEGGLLVAFDMESGEERWRFTIDAPLRCSPTIAEGRILLAGCDAKLHAIDASTGKEVSSVDIGSQTGNSAAASGGRSFFGTEGGAFLAVNAKGRLAEAWQFNNPRRASGIRTAAAASEQAIVFANEAKTVFALNPATGEPLWETPTRSRVEASPIIVGDRVVIGTSRGRLLLLDLANGEETWQYNAGGKFLSGAAAVDGRLLITNDDGRLYCFGKKQ
ncbi:Outer membrane protein assembly factor BamB precursor [Posidoniimonas corsicana]|uniref:Outer membrane protein assembly factor BamB n=1 Tax=Posidoniimonas corsicana TaxID=1938618 RepID=A0A5C5V735_9BACT|nr:PQQ-binding-like beta-propeller repeat protein [Posidoniimonas corsicana]TWT33617.1 Outer membrane protein assembly factor BamB precursor [Posidoniimonas corsicana]